MDIKNELKDNFIKKQEPEEFKEITINLFFDRGTITLEVPKIPLVSPSGDFGSIIYPVKIIGEPPKELGLKNTSYLALKLGRGKAAQQIEKYTYITEFLIGKMIKNQHIREVYEVGITEYYSKKEAFCLLVEYIDGNVLSDDMLSDPFLFTKTPEQRMVIIKQSAKGLNFLHKNNILHRDFRPKNILVIDKNGELIVKIIDLGIAYFHRKIFEQISKITKNTIKIQDLINSNLSINPKKEYYNTSTCSSDWNLLKKSEIFSFCITAYKILALCHPFHDIAFPNNLVSEFSINHIILPCLEKVKNSKKKIENILELELENEVWLCKTVFIVRKFYNITKKFKRLVLAKG